MTILVGIVGSDGIILAADQLMVKPARTEGEFDDRMDIWKIHHSPKHKVVYAGVGDSITRDAGRELFAALDSDRFNFVPIYRSLEQIAIEITKRAATEGGPAYHPDVARSLLIVFYGRQGELTKPELWLLTIHDRAYHAERVEGMCISGGIGNAARFFSYYFRDRHVVPIASLALLAAHIVLMAGHWDNSMIGGLDVAMVSSRGYRLMNEDEKLSLRHRSATLDTAIRNQLLLQPTVDNGG